MRTPSGSDDGPLAQAVDRLTRAGYTEIFEVASGQLVSTPTGHKHDPGGLVVDEIRRFEGPSDPADAAVIFALTCPRTGLRGTFIAAYGATVDPADAAVIRQLEEAARERNA